MAQQSTIYRHQKSESFGSKIFNVIFRLLRQTRYLGKKLSNLDNFKNEAGSITRAVKKHCTIKEETVGGRALWTLSPKQGSSNTSVFYIHGGAYVFNMTALQWNFLAKIVAETKVTVMVANYPIAPQSNAEAAYKYMHELYELFLDRNGDKEIQFLADSAGAGLAISFAQYLNEIKLPQPKKIILSSPWLDVSLTNPDIQNVIPLDKALEIKSLQKAGKLWAGKWDTKDPKVSPIYGQFDDIGKIYMFMGTSELFVSDAQKLVKRLEKEDIPINYYEYPKMFHCWLLFPLPEGKAAMNQIIEIIKNPSV